MKFLYSFVIDTIVVMPRDATCDDAVYLQRRVERGGGGVVGVPCARVGAARGVSSVLARRLPVSLLRGRLVLRRGLRRGRRGRRQLDLLRAQLDRDLRQPHSRRLSVHPRLHRTLRSATHTLTHTQQTWNWVIGSPGQWVIWVIFHVRVTGSSF